MLDRVGSGFVAQMVAAALNDDITVADDRTTNRIIDAALAEIGARGLAGLTVDGVARRARMNRTTIYRRFGDREGLVSAVAASEGRAALRAATDAMRDVSDPAQRLIHGFVAMVRFARTNAIVQRIVVHEPGDLIAGDHGELLFRMGSGFVAEQFRDVQRQGFATHLDADQAAETAAAIFLGLLLSPTAAINLDSDEAAQQYALRTLVPMFLGTPQLSDDPHHAVGATRPATGLPIRRPAGAG